MSARADVARVENRYHALLIEDDDYERATIRQDLAGAPDSSGVRWDVTAVPSFAAWQIERAGSARLSGPCIDVAIIDYNLGLGPNGAEVSRKLKAADPYISTILLTGEASASAIEALRDGSFDDHFLKDWYETDGGPEQLALRCRLLALLSRERRQASGPHRRSQSAALDALPDPELARRIRAVIAPSEMPVLIFGESGTGKEYVARAIHEASGIDGPFYAVNCAGFAEQTAESELFGHSKSSFTGADQHHLGAVFAAAGLMPSEGDASHGGLFEKWITSAPGFKPRKVKGIWRFPRSDGSFEGPTGTLFLDEVADLAPRAQTLLLRFLDNYGFLPKGHSGAPFGPTVRIIAATNRKEKMLGNDVSPIRRDLYWRLAGWVIELPSLRERPADAIQIATAVARKELCVELNEGAKQALMELLKSGAFASGNMRALLWCVKRAWALAGANAVELSRAHIEEASRSEYSGPAFSVRAGGAARRVPASVPPPPPDLKNLLRQFAAGEQGSPEAMIPAIARWLNDHDSSPESLEKWLTVPGQIVDVPSFTPEGSPWPLWFVGGLLVAIKSKPTWVEMSGVLKQGRDRKDTKQAMETILRALRTYGVPVDSTRQHAKTFFVDLASALVGHQGVGSEALAALARIRHLIPR
jgi:DNA-binding NtrC family response regulator